MDTTKNHKNSSDFNGGSQNDMESQSSSTKLSNFETNSQRSNGDLHDQVFNNKRKSKRSAKKHLSKYKDYNLNDIDAAKFFQNESPVLSEKEWIDLINSNKEIKLVSTDRIR
jgi:hypothetical protein